MSEQRVTYATYLALDELLAAQHPRSEEHDELLFIVIHQVYELWFKQLTHEALRLQSQLDEADSSGAMGTMARMLTILKTIVGQVDVLETMTRHSSTRFAATSTPPAAFSRRSSASSRCCSAVATTASCVTIRPAIHGTNG